MPTEPDIRDIVAAHFAATTAAFQCLVHVLQQNGALERGEVADRIRLYMEATQDRNDPVMLALLHDLRQSLMD